MYMEEHRMIYTCHTQVVMHLHTQCSHGADWLTLSEYQPTSTWLGSKQKQQATTGVKGQTLKVFYQGASTSDRPPVVWKYKHSMCFIVNTII